MAAAGAALSEMLLHGAKPSPGVVGARRHSRRDSSPPVSGCAECRRTRQRRIQRQFAGMATSCAAVSRTESSSRSTSSMLRPLLTGKVIVTLTLLSGPITISGRTAALSAALCARRCRSRVHYQVAQITVLHRRFLQPFRGSRRNGRFELPRRLQGPDVRRRSRDSVCVQPVSRSRRRMSGARLLDPVLALETAHRRRPGTQPGRVYRLAAFDAVAIGPIRQPFQRCFNFAQLPPEAVIARQIQLCEQAVRCLIGPIARNAVGGRYEGAVRRAFQPIAKLRQQRRSRVAQPLGQLVDLTARRSAGARSLPMGTLVRSRGHLRGKGQSGRAGGATDRLHGISPRASSGSGQAGATGARSRSHAA